MSDSEQLRVCYEGVVRQNPSNVEAVHYLALWHLERHSFQQVKQLHDNKATHIDFTPHAPLINHSFPHSILVPFLGS